MRIFNLFFALVVCLSPFTLFIQGQSSDQIQLTDSIKIPARDKNGCHWVSSSIIKREKPADLAGLFVYGFRGIFGKNTLYTAHYNYPPIISDILLDKTEVIIDSNSSAQNNLQKLQVTVSAIDIQNDVITYGYTVSAGKIIGVGSNVIWDLSGVKPGAYTIDVRVDDGLGCEIKDAKNKFTKEVRVIECSGCK
jgi:hypothetical protein